MKTIKKILELVFLFFFTGKAIEQYDSQLEANYEKKIKEALTYHYPNATKDELQTMFLLHDLDVSHGVESVFDRTIICSYKGKQFLEISTDLKLFFTLKNGFEVKVIINFTTLNKFLIF